jgi:CheY-like chemotaxis protein
MSGILIIDDDPTIRAMFARALKPLGEVETAANGADALRFLGSKRYGVILLDLHMPVIDGFVLLHTLSARPGPNRETPIYVVTADNSEQARLRALKHRALFLLTKPVPIATLTGLVSATLKKASEHAHDGSTASTPVAPAIALTPPPPATRSSPATPGSRPPVPVAPSSASSPSRKPGSS